MMHVLCNRIHYGKICNQLGTRHIIVPLAIRIITKGNAVIIEALYSLLSVPRKLYTIITPYTAEMCRGSGVWNSEHREKCNTSSLVESYQRGTSE